MKARIRVSQIERINRMMKKLFWLTGVVLLVIAGCTLGSTAPTGDTSNDPSAAQQFLPNLAGYNRTNAESLTSAVTSISGGAALISGNPLLAALITRIDTMMQCYQNVGAVAASVYTQADLGQILAGQVPRLGAVAVINQDRLSRNFLNCVIGGGGAAAQAVSIEPCAGSGSIVVNNETITYIYGGTDPSFCTSVQQHFDALQ
jgi:hypothetical protein